MGVPNELMVTYIHGEFNLSVETALHHLQPQQVFIFKMAIIYVIVVTMLCSNLLCGI